MALAIFNYSRFYYIYKVYSSINKDSNKKEQCNILKYFDIYKILTFIT